VASCLVAAIDGLPTRASGLDHRSLLRPAT